MAEKWKTGTKKTGEQMIDTIMGNVRRTGRCYPDQLIRVIGNRYGMQDLAEWVKSNTMVKDIAELDPDVALCWEKLMNYVGLSKNDMFKNVDLKDYDTRAYCYNLYIRLSVLAALQGEDMQSIEDIQEQEEIG